MEETDHNDSRIEGRRKIQWTFMEIFQPLFEELIQIRGGYTMKAYDLWVSQLFDRNSRVVAVKWFCAVDNTTGTVHYGIVLGYTLKNKKVVIAHKRYFWSYDYINNVLSWDKP